MDLAVRSGSEGSPRGEQQSRDVTLDSTTSSKAKQQAMNRMGRACDNCRRRKIRCDAVGGPNGTESALAEQPCSLCTTQNVPCHFEFRAPKRAPNKNYVESLEKRLEAMEGLLSSLSDPGAAPPNRPTSAVPPIPRLPPTTTTPGWQTPVQKRTSASGPPAFSSGHSPQSISTSPEPVATDLDAIQRLSDRLDDLVVEHDRYVGRETGLHLLQSVNQHFAIEVPPEAETDLPLVDSLIDNLHQTLQFTTSEVAPDLAPRLIDAYYTFGTWGFTILPRPYFEECLEKGLLSTDRSFRSLYYAMCAVGARFVDDHRLIPKHPVANARPNQLQMAKGFDLYWTSLVYSKMPVSAPTLFDLMQSVIALTWLIGSTGFLTAWTMVGIAIRRAVDAGIHREVRSRWVHSPVEDQSRRRLFHVLLTLDQWISSGIGRPTALNKEDADVALPLEISDADLWEWELATRRARQQALPPPSPPQVDANTVIYGLQAITSLFGILESARKLFYPVKREPVTDQAISANLRQIDTALNTWLANLPLCLQWNPTHQDNMALCGSAFVACHYFFAQIYIHRDFISPSRSHAIGYPSLEIATNAARACSRILDVLRHRDCLKQTYTWVPLIAIQSGMMLLLSVFANPPGPSGSARTTLTESAAADVKRCLIALEYFSDKTYMAKKCHEGLLKLAAMVAAPPTSSRSAAPSYPDPLRSSLKRSGQDDWTDGRSPADSSRGSGSDKQSPVESTCYATFAEQGHKARRTDTSSQHLPFTTEDLSSQTFNGRPTFLFDQTTAPSVPDGQQAVPISVAQTFSGPGGSHTVMPNGTLSLPELSVAAPKTPLPTSTPLPPDYSLPHVTPTLANPTANGFDFQMPPGSPDLLSALYSSGGVYDSSSFWQLAMDDPLAVPQTVEQVASDMMFQLGDGAGGQYSGPGAQDSWMMPFDTSPTSDKAPGSFDSSLLNGLPPFSSV